MTSLQLVNAQADIVRKAAALGININAAKGLQEVLKTNLGPKGTIKMYVTFKFHRSNFLHSVEHSRLLVF